VGDTHPPACEVVGESQFGRLERKLSTLSTLWPVRRVKICGIVVRTVCPGGFTWKSSSLYPPGAQLLLPEIER
jgi:hypothetical protein